MRRIARSHFNTAACLKKREDQIRRATRDLRTRVGKFMEGGNEIFEHS